MSIKQANIGNHIITYDNQTREIIAFQPTKDYQKEKEEMTLKILESKEEFKKRGSLVVLPEYTTHWSTLIDNSLSNLEQIWYNGACIEAALQCMETLHQGLPVEDAYKHIDVQSSEPCVHLGMELSGWQNYAISSLIGSYHIRGPEFVDYRNKYVNQEEQHVKQKTSKE